MIDKTISVIDGKFVTIEFATISTESKYSLYISLFFNIILADFSKDNDIEFKVKDVIKTKTRVKDENLKDFIKQPIKAFFADSSCEDYTNSTIHSVKGCTFEAVMLIINSSGKLTENMINTKPIDSEEIRTFYVAATRARKLFVLALPDKKNVPTETTRLPKDFWNYKCSLFS
jgi:superfamily I DNA/RNA helicase